MAWPSQPGQAQPGQAQPCQAYVIRIGQAKVVSVLQIFGVSDLQMFEVYVLLYVRRHGLRVAVRRKFVEALAESQHGYVR